MSTVTIVLLVILVILIALLVGLYFFGKKTREFDSLGSPNASQSLIRLYFFCQFLILYFHVMLSYVIITMR